MGVLYLTERVDACLILLFYVQFYDKPNDIILTNTTTP